MNESFAYLHDRFEHSSLSELSREAVALTLASRFDCSLCKNLHSHIAKTRGASPALIEALLQRENIPSPELAAIARFTERIVDTQGAVSDAELEAFLAHGFTAQNALEVVLGVATYTLSIFSNRLTRTEAIR